MTVGNKDWKSGTQADSVEDRIKTMQTDIKKLAALDSGILLLVYGMPGVGKSVLLASMCQLGKVLFIDLTNQERSIAQYAKQLKDVDYITIYETDKDGKFDAGMTCEKLVKALASKSPDYKYVAIDGYSAIIKYYNMYLRQKLGFEPIPLKPVGSNEIQYSDWSWRNENYIMLQGMLQALTTKGKFVTCSAEAEQETIFVADEKGKRTPIKANEFTPVLKNDESDIYMFDVIGFMYIEKAERRMRFYKTKVPGIPHLGELAKPTFKKIIELKDSIKDPQLDFS